MSSLLAQPLGTQGMELSPPEMQEHLWISLENMKRSRARVAIEGQCVLLQISLSILFLFVK